MTNPEDDVLTSIDALVDWEMTESPAAIAEHFDGGELGQLAAFMESIVNMFLAIFGAWATSDEMRQILADLEESLNNIGENNDSHTDPAS